MDHGASTGAVDLPRRRIEPELGRRRHRRITGPSGVLLFICLFLPAVKGCDAPVYPLTMPMFVHPYVFGLVVAVGAGSLTLRGLRHTVIALRVLAWLTIVGACALAVTIPVLGLVELVLGFVFLAAIGRRGVSERRVALTAIAVGTASLVWFGLWCLTPDRLVGVILSMGAATGLMVGGLVWLSESAYDSAHGWNQPDGIPRARARGRISARGV